MYSSECIYFLQQSVEATVDMRYITYRTLLNTPTGRIIPESGKVMMSLHVSDERWSDRFGGWDADSRTFTEVRI